MKKILSRIFFPAALLVAVTARGQVDSLHQADSVVEVEGACPEGFFTGAERVQDERAFFLVAKNGRTYSLASFRKTFHIGDFSENALADLDGDGKKEFILTNYTGGAHCCDEIYVFRSLSPVKFRYAGKMFAGHTCIHPGGRFDFSFYEPFGYFFTCYACAYRDTADTAPIPVGQVIIRYHGGKLQVEQGTSELRSMIRDNLAKLGEQPYEPLEVLSQDNGLRKEFALNLAVYYYSFGKNLVATRGLFNEFYRFPDKKDVWAEFQKILQLIKSQNSF